MTRRFDEIERRNADLFLADLMRSGGRAVPYGTEIVFEVGGKRYLDKYAAHNDGPGGPRPTDHPGIDLYEATP